MGVTAPGYSLTAEQLDQALLAMDQEAAFNPLEMRAINKTLLSRYEDPADGVVTDDYLQYTFAAGLHGTPDRTKIAFHHKGAYPDGEAMTQHIHRFSEKQYEALEQLGNMMSNGSYMPMGGMGDGKIDKDALSTAIGVNGTGGGNLINQRVIPQLSVWFNTETKILRRLPRMEAPGLDYEWNNLIALGDESNLWLDEEGSPITTKGVYFRGKTNIGLLGVQRQTTLKLDLAIRAGGVLYNGGMSAPELEMMNAMTLRARGAEKTILQGCTASGHTGSDEFGLSYPNAFNGLRILLSGNANAVHDNFYPDGFLPLIFEATDTSGEFPKPITKAIRKAITAIRNRGGRPTAIYCSYTMAEMIANEHLDIIRLMQGDAVGGEGFVAGAQVAAVASPGGPVPLVPVPDDNMGSYQISSIQRPTINSIQLPATQLSGTVCQDIYVVSEGDLAAPYLGSPDPMPIEVGLGFPNADGTGVFTRKLIVYMFLGFAVHVPVHCAKVRVTIA